MESIDIEHYETCLQKDKARKEYTEIEVDPNEVVVSCNCCGAFVLVPRTKAVAEIEVKE